jgi:hypothetical protein
MGYVFLSYRVCLFRRDSIPMIYEKIFVSVDASFFVPFSAMLRLVDRLNSDRYVRAAAHH